LLVVGLAPSGRAEDRPPATFFRGVNLGGPPLVIDGHPWGGQDAPSLRQDGRPLDRPTIPLNPGTDRNRAAMIRSSVQGEEVVVTLNDVPRVPTPSSSTPGRTTRRTATASP